MEDLQVAEAAGKSEAKSLGYETKVRISSSGTMADFPLITTPDIKPAIVSFVTEAVKNGLLTEDRLVMLDEDPRKILDELVEIEARWRNRYIRESMGMIYSSHIIRQTIVRPEARLILPIDEKTLEGVRDIYDNPDNLNPRPTIALLPEFAGVDCNLHDGNISSYNGYREFAKNVEKSARLAVRKALRD